MEKHTAKAIVKRTGAVFALVAGSFSAATSLYGIIAQDQPSGPKHWFHSLLSADVPVWSYSTIILLMLLLFWLFQALVWRAERNERKALSRDEVARLLDFQGKELEAQHIHRLRLRDENQKIQEEMAHLFLELAKAGDDHAGLRKRIDLLNQIHAKWEETIVARLEKYDGLIDKQMIGIAKIFAASRIERAALDRAYESGFCDKGQLPTTGPSALLAAQHFYTLKEFNGAVSLLKLISFVPRVLGEEAMRNPELSESDLIAVAFQRPEFDFLRRHVPKGAIEPPSFASEE